MKTIVLLLLVICFHTCFSQTMAEMKNLDSSYQACLDTGAAMLNCSTEYYRQMDSLLNLAYDRLRKRNPANAGNLRKEQLSWLKKRTVYFAKLTKNDHADGLTGQDREMVINDKKARFVRYRVVVLMKMK